MPPSNQPQNWQGRRVHLGRGSSGAVQSTSVGRALGTGGEGTVYADATRPDFVLKIMHNPTPTSDAKTRAMLAAPPSAQVGTYQGADLVQIAWPQERLTDGGGGYVGFSMRFLDVSKTIGLGAWTNLRERRLNNLSLDDRLRVHLAANLASVTEYINDAGHALVDLKPLNVLAYRTDGYVCLVDCDGFRVQHAGAVFPASAYTPDFLAPEYHGYTVSASQLGEEQDRFALAIVIFQLLDNGIHPYAGNDGLSFVLHDRIMRQRTFLDANSGLTPPSSSHAAFFADDTLDLFLRAFTGPATQRPSAAEWRQHLQQLAQQGLHMCGGDPDHWHYGKGCPWCAQAMQLTPPVQRTPVRASAVPSYAAPPPSQAPAPSAPWSPAPSTGPAVSATGAPAMSVGGSAFSGWKKTAAGIAFLVLLGGGVWAVMRPAGDHLASQNAHLDRVVTQFTTLTELLGSLRKNTSDADVAPLVKMAENVNGAIQGARSAIGNRNAADADASLTRADGSITTLASAIIALAGRPTPPAPVSPPPVDVPSTDPPPTQPQNVWEAPKNDPFGGDGGFVKPAPPKEDTSSGGFGHLIGPGGFIKPYVPPAIHDALVQRLQSLQQRADRARQIIAGLRVRAQPPGDLNALAARLENGLSDAADAIKDDRENDANTALDSAEAALDRLERR